MTILTLVVSLLKLNTGKWGRYHFLLLASSTSSMYPFGMFFSKFSLEGEPVLGLLLVLILGDNMVVVTPLLVSVVSVFIVPELFPSEMSFLVSPFSCV